MNITNRFSVHFLPHIKSIGPSFPTSNQKPIFKLLASQLSTQSTEKQLKILQEKLSKVSSLATSTRHPGEKNTASTMRNKILKEIENLKKAIPRNQESTAYTPPYSTRFDDLTELLQNGNLFKAKVLIQSMPPGPQKEEALFSLAIKFLENNKYTISLEIIRSMQPGSKKEEALLTRAHKFLEKDKINEAIEALKSMQPGSKKEDALLSVFNTFCEKRDFLSAGITLQAMQPETKKRLPLHYQFLYFILG